MRGRVVLLAAVWLIGCGCGPREAGTGGPAPAARTPAAKADPTKAKALYQRGLAIQRDGDVDGGIRHFYLALEADPDFAPALNHFAWLRATDTDPKLRDGTEAVSMSERACAAAVVPGKPSIFAANCLDTLAAAYAEAGRFDDAVRAAGRAIEMAGKLANQNAVRHFTSRRRLFEDKKPYRE